MCFYYTLEIKYAHLTKEERIVTVLLNGQLGATLNAASLNHSTASFCGNTSTKTVGAGAVTRMWLVSSFWHICTIVPNFTPFYKM
jgi:hypothetical protein